MPALSPSPPPPAPASAGMAAANPVGARLLMLSQRLAEVLREDNGRGLAVGGRLGAAVGVFNRLQALFADLHATLHGDDVAGAAGRLAAVGAEITVIAAALAEERAALVRLRTLNRQVATRIGRFKRTVRAIAMLSTKAQIAAALLDQGDENIANFTGQFRQLAGSAGQATTAAAKQCEALNGLLAAAQATLSGFAAAHGERLRVVAGQLEACVGSVETQRQRATAAAVAIGDRSAAIAAETGVMVMALQVTDITRQRVEHVCEALSLVGHGLDGDPARPAAWCEGLAAAASTSVAARVVRLQEAQLAVANRQFDTEVGRVEAALRTLVADAASLVDLGFRSYGAGDGRYGSFLDDLKLRLAEATALIRACQTERLAVDADMAAAAEALGSLLGTLAGVRAIEADVRLVGLNTRFTCDRLGAAGRVLAVIAQQLAARAARLGGEVEALLAILEEIGDAARVFDGHRQARGGDSIARLEATTAAALAVLCGSGDRLGSALATLAGDGAAVGGELRAASGELASLVDAGRLLRGEHGRLRQLAEGLNERPEDRPLVDERMRFFPADRYTMASERAVHAAIGAGKPVLAIDTDVDHGGGDGLDDIFF